MYIDWNKWKERYRNKYTENKIKWTRSKLWTKSCLKRGRNQTKFKNFWRKIREIIKRRQPNSGWFQKSDNRINNIFEWIKKYLINWY
jgi:hypothetical protein